MTEMKVAGIMETDVTTVTIDSPVSEVLVSLVDGEVTGLPVVDTRNRVIGVVSSTDMGVISQTDIVRAVATGKIA